MLGKSVKLVGKVLELSLLFFFLTAILIFLIPHLFHISQHVVLSGSMEPAIRTGSLCFVNQSTEIEEIEKGDAIAFKRIDGSLVVHRVSRLEDGKIFTKGDANDMEDISPVQKEMYFGKAIFSIPYLGYVTVFLQKGWVRVAAGVIVVVFFLLETLPMFSRKENKRYEKT